MDCFRNRGDMSRSRSAAATDDVEPTVFGPLFNRGAHVFGAKVELSHLIRRTGVWMAADIGCRNFLQFFNVGPHRVGPLCAVHADADHREVTDAVPKCFHDLT